MLAKEGADRAVPYVGPLMFSFCAINLCTSCEVVQSYCITFSGCLLGFLFNKMCVCVGVVCCVCEIL